MWIHQLQALWPVGGIHAAPQLPNGHCEDGMYCLHGGSTICIVGGYFSGTSEGRLMGNNLELFGEFLGFFLVFRLFYYYIIHIHV